jgi:AcrR family transcriptional regulator
MVDQPDSTIRPTTHAKVRILATADQLFYAEGVHTIGVDRIISEAHVTKATFYKYYRSKDALIVAYLQGRDKKTRDFLAGLADKYDTPEQHLRALSTEISEEVMRETFYGCPFINAAAQFTDPTHPVREAVTAHREWYISAVENLFRGMGHPSTRRCRRRLLPRPRRRLLQRPPRRPGGRARRAAQVYPADAGRYRVLGLVHHGRSTVEVDHVAAGETDAGRSHQRSNLIRPACAGDRRDDAVTGQQPGEGD